MLAAHALLAAAVVAAVLLGLWQLDVWRAERESTVADLSGATPVPLTDVVDPGEAFPAPEIGRPVEVAGTWVPDATLLVEGRVLDGRTGLWVVTPVDVDGAALAVVRGWVASEDDVPPPPTGAVDLAAWLQPPDGTLEMDRDPTDDVFPQLRSADLAQRVDTEVFSAYAVAQDGVGGLPSAGLATPPEVGFGAGLKNLLYGIQWWVFGAFAVFIWWRFVQEERKPAPAEHPVASSV